MKRILSWALFAVLSMGLLTGCTDLSASSGDESSFPVAAALPLKDKNATESPDEDINEIERLAAEEAAKAEAEKKAKEETEKKAAEEKAAVEKKAAEEAAEKGTKTESSSGSVKSQAANSEEKSLTYILNTNTKKFHYPYCSSVDQMAEKNKKEYTGNRSAVIEQGYEPCKRCKP